MDSDFKPNFLYDIPLAYAVYKLIYNENKTKVIDCEFSYVNDFFPKSFNLSTEDIIGKKVTEVFENATSQFFYNIYCASKGKEQRDYLTIEANNHMYAYAVSPCQKKGYVSAIYINIDRENRRSIELNKAVRTDNAIINIVKILNSDYSYEFAMNSVLKELSKVIDADRIYILETDGITVENTFELCKDGVKSQINNLKNIPYSVLKEYFKVLEDSPFVDFSNINGIQFEDEYLYSLLSKQSVSRLLAFPFYSNGKIIGFLGLDNYREGYKYDTIRIAQEVSCFIASELGSHILMNKLEYASKYDILTDLYNRFGFNQACEEYLENLKDEKFAFIVMDIDDFKTFNDRYGHLIGDYLLKSFSMLLKRSFSSRDIIGRTGGDEFCVLVKDININDIACFIKKFSQSQKKLHYDGNDYPYETSIGYSIYPIDSTNSTELFKYADDALYYVKLHGKHDYKRYKPTINLSGRERLGFSLQSIVRNLPGVIFVFDAYSNKMLYANPECIRLFECEDIDDFMNYTNGSVKGILSADEWEEIDMEVWRQINNPDNDKRYVMEYDIITKTGKRKRVNEWGHLVHDNRYGDVFYVILVPKDKINK